MKFSEYKAFAKPAQEAGLDRDERKLAMMDPSTLLEGLGDDIKKHLDAEKLTTLFSSLQGNEVSEPRNILEVGNMLYRYRKDVRGLDRKGIESLNEQDKRLLELGFHMMENALYTGKLHHIKKEQAGALAFTANVMAKLLEQHAIATWNPERLTSFIKDIDEYERKTLCSQMDFNEGEPMPRAASEKLRKDIEQKIAALGELEARAGWPRYFQELAAKLESAMWSLEEEGVVYPLGHPFSLPSVRRVISDLRAPVPPILKSLRETRAKLIKATQVHPLSYEGIPAQLIERKGLTALTQEDDMMMDKSDYRYMVGKHANQDKDNTTAKGKPNIIKGLDGLREINKDKRISAALETIGAVFNGEKLGGPLVEYEKAMKNIDNLLVLRKKIITEDQHFTTSKERIARKANRPETVMYLIKLQLIADNILGDYSPDSWTGHALATLKEPYEFKTTREEPTHAFLKSRNSWGDMEDGPAYANLHFVREEIPFAVWALRYAQSKK